MTDKTLFRVQVFKRDGSLWTDFKEDDYFDVVRKTDDWKRQPGTGQVIVTADLNGAKAVTMNWTAAVIRETT